MNRGYGGMMNDQDKETDAVRAIVRGIIIGLLIRIAYNLDKIVELLEKR